MAGFLKQGFNRLLDDYLTTRGYAHQDPTLVLTAALDAAPRALEPRLVPLADWLDAYTRLSGMPARARALHGAILRGMPQPCAYAVIGEPSKPLACGLGVLEQDLLGLFDVVTDTDARRQGHGRALVSGLLAWGRRNGAQRAYLQMVRDNDPARALYDSLGFAELYAYWYRVSA